MSTKNLKPLSYKTLRQKLPLSQLDFETTEKIKALTEFVGQKRAVDALNFGIGIKSQGYNLYALGPPGIGKNSLVHIVLSEHAKKNPTPSDWCYIHNFENPEKPIALELPAGQGVILAQEMKDLQGEMLASVLAVYESDEYHAGLKKITDFFNRKQSRIRKKNPVNSKNKIPHLYRERHERIKQLKNTFLTGAVKPHIEKYQKKYAKNSLIVNHLKAMQLDLIEHVDELISLDEKTNLLTYSNDNPALIKYKVNLIVDNSQLTGAPIIFEENPAYSNLICRVEYTTEQGFMITNFSLIRAGSLHLANGGYLLIEARKIIENPEAWEALKSALFSRKIKIDPIRNKSNAANPISLEPMPIPLQTKVILLGDRATYYALYEEDPDFLNLFKVPVDFDEYIVRNKQNIQLYARLVGTIAQREKLKPFHARAVAAIIDYSSRLAEDIQKLTTHISDIESIILEADYWAGEDSVLLVDASHVKKAIDAKIHRMDRSREMYYEDIHREFIVINTQGKLTGQVNCLSVRRVGGFMYGHPTRVTARVRPGKGHLIDIQREIKMAGPLHNKAGLIITNFLASRFVPEHLFSLTASLAFEQLYCWTDGDSASVGELCALLSALADVPILQHLAVTGAIDQYGDVQSIGGVNEKIEGFFDVCVQKGLTGTQGVLIPAVNVQNLMLREDIVLAAKEKKFFIYSIATVDDAITLLTGVSIGSRNKKGGYPRNSLYYKIEKKLELFSKKRKRTNKN